MAETEKNSIQQFIEVIKAVPPGKKISFTITLIMVVSGFVILLLWTNRPDFQVLFANLDTADAARITEKLREKKIPFQIKEGGSAVLVPDDTVYQLRLELASDGIPRGQNVGFEIFDEMPFGTTEFVQKLKYQQALQGELARTIMGFEAVAKARVHIVASGDSLFAEPEKPSTASVVLRLHPGRILDQRQLQGITNLVARAVKGLRPENVSLVDMAGGLLSRGYEGDNAGMSSRIQFEHQQKMERILESRIQTMLEPIVGLNKVVARVSAELDFGQVNVVEEKFDPDSVVVRSEQRETESSTGSKNLPAGSPDLQSQVYRSEGGSGGGAKNFQKENAVINYEINKINRQITNSVGDVKRLSAAVVIDGPYVSEKGPDGEAVQKFVPRSRREMKNFEDIIKKAMGFNEARGDQVNVSNIPFALQEEGVVLQEKIPSWMDYAKRASKPSFNVLLVILFFVLGIRPFKKWLNKTGETLATRALPRGEEVPRLAGLAGEGQRDSTERDRLLDVTKSNPDLAAQVIRSWIGEGR
jgi:flagellar M-ring protein FliF